MLPRKTFIYFLLDTPSGKAYYRDKGGTVLSQVITASKDVTLQSPANWLDTTLGYDRNETYHGIARSYSTPQELVKDAQQIVKELFLLGVGTEVPLTLAVFKYNSQPKTGEPEYKLYFKANLDLTEINETVLESLTVPLMEGGVTQLLKSYENTTVTIPCDGSIQENQKVNLDGLLVPDVFYYQVIPVEDIKLIANILPCTFLTNEGDNYGIIHNDPSFQTLSSYNDLKNNGSYIFSSVSPIVVKIKGSIVVKPTTSTPTTFKLFYTTDATIGTLIPFVDFTDVVSQSVFSFEADISLKANEKLFIVFDLIFGNGSITSGNFSLSFESQAKATRAWAVNSFDLFKLILGQINLLSSTQFQAFNYQAVSDLLNQYNHFFFTSGDALRASGDSTYQRFYSISQTNKILQSQYGPVIKITLKDFFQSMEAILCAELQSGNNGTTETLSIELLDSLYNSDVINFSIGEISSLKWSYAKDLGFSDFEIGYAPQTYDQKAGKYEYNTTLEMKAPINSFQKKLSKISKIRWDSYGIERLRSNIGDATSTTRNDSDNSVFGINVNNSSFIYDFFNANFTSTIPNPDDSNNTNINLDKNVSLQPIQMPITDGEYFQPNLDQSIITISDRGQSATEACSLTIDGTVNSNNKPPLADPDTCTIKIWQNGVVLYTSITEVTGINTPIVFGTGGTFNFSIPVFYKDCFYITMETTATATATINTASLVIGDIITNASAANVPIDTGAFKLLSFSSFTPQSKPYVVGTSRAQYGYQYFTFNSRAVNREFLLEAGFEGYISGEAADFVIEVYINGVLQSEKITVHGQVSRSNFINTLASFKRTFHVNDIVFFTASVLGSLGNLTVSLTSANLLLTSTYIKAYSLKRVQYDSLTGIPNLAKDTSGNIRTDIAGAPYNIEDVTPKTIYRNWRNYIMSCFMDQVTGDMKFQTLSKNSFLSRTYNGVTITENSNEPILGFKRLFYPINLEIGVNVPQGFAELMAVSKNAHIHCTFMGTDIYFFSDSLKQKPALNESQVWKGKLSPKTDLAAFSKINGFKIPDMQNNSLSCAFAAPFQVVPYAATLDAKYHTLNRNEFLFKDQIGNWLNKDDYGQPVQIGDPIPLQYIARGLSNVTVSFYRKSDNSLYSGPTNLDVMTSPAVSDPYTLWQKSIGTTGWERDNYYFVISAAGSNVYRSEPLLVRRPDELEDTVLIEYSHSSNTQGLVFDAGFVGSMRIRGGFDNKFKQKYLGKFYTDQPQDITVLNAIPYEVTTLLIGRGGGVPDYVPKKVLRALLMDQTTLDGEGFSLNDGAQFEEVFTKGAPMKFHSIEIRPSKNLGANAALPSGVADNDSSLIVTVNPQSFGPNVSNSSGTTETDLIQITVN